MEHDEQRADGQFHVAVVLAGRRARPARDIDGDDDVHVLADEVERQGIGDATVDVGMLIDLRTEDDARDGDRRSDGLDSMTRSVMVSKIVVTALKGIGRSSMLAGRLSG